MMYLSFSFIYLVCIILVWSMVMFFVHKSGAIKVKQTVLTYLFGLLVIGFLAVDVGQTRDTIDRSQFNKVTEEVVEKNLSNRIDAKTTQLENKAVPKYEN